MPKVLNEDAHILFESVDLDECKNYATERWPGCWFDGDPDFGADQIYIFMTDCERELGTITDLEED